jgi:ribonuclease VapC
MIIDTSAALAALLREPERDHFESLIASAQQVYMSAAAYLEAGIVVDGRRDPILSRTLDEWLASANVHIEPVTVEQAQIARDAYRDFGRGSGHPARLNFGDCLSYALAKDLDQPLLYKGDDFLHTDVRPAAPVTDGN